MSTLGAPPTKAVVIYEGDTFVEQITVTIAGSPMNVSGFTWLAPQLAAYAGAETEATFEVDVSNAFGGVVTFTLLPESISPQATFDVRFIDDTGIIRTLCVFTALVEPSVSSTSGSEGASGSAPVSDATTIAWGTPFVIVSPPASVQQIIGPAGPPGAEAAQGVLASRPAASVAGVNALYYATDTSTLYISSGSAWSAAADPYGLAAAAEAASTPLTPAVDVINPASGSMVLNVNNGTTTSFSVVLGANSTFSFSNFPVGLSADVLVWVTGSFTPLFSGVTWLAGVPSFTPTGTLYVFACNSAGVILGSSPQQYYIAAGTVTATDVDGTIVTSSQLGEANGVATLGATGLVPTTSLGIDTASSGNYLRGDGTWTIPPSPINAQCVAVANITSLSGLQTIDGYTMLHNDIVLLTAQSTTSQNGLWQAPSTGSGAWARPTVFPTTATVLGLDVGINGGTTYANTVWSLSGTVVVTIDASNQTWVMVGRIAGTGLALTGDTLSVSYGTAAGTAAQGNDSRITGALQAANNLSDVANKGTAKYDLGIAAHVCKVVAVTNQSTTGQPTIDGYATTNADIVLLTAQSTTSQNGPWQLPATGTGAWARPTWFPSAGTVGGMVLGISGGTVYGGSVWCLETTSTLTIDTSPLTWAAVAGASLDGTGHLEASEFPALTGDATTAAGSLATTVGKVNGVAITAAAATLASQLANATLRNTSTLPATALAGEETVLTGSTAGGTLTLPTTPQSSTQNQILNNSTKSATIAAGGSDSLSSYGTIGSITLLPGASILLIYVSSSTTWYVFSLAASPPNIQAFASTTAGNDTQTSATWTKPTGNYTKVDILCIAAGGGGGAGGVAANGTICTGGGGGGGAASQVTSIPFASFAATETVKTGNAGLGGVGVSTGAGGSGDGGGASSMTVNGTVVPSAVGGGGGGGGQASGVAGLGGGSIARTAYPAGGGPPSLATGAAGTAGGAGWTGAGGAGGGVTGATPGVTSAGGTGGLNPSGGFGVGGVAGTGTGGGAGGSPAGFASTFPLGGGGGAGGGSESAANQNGGAGGTGADWGGGGGGGGACRGGTGTSGAGGNGGHGIVIVICS